MWFSATRRYYRAYADDVALPFCVGARLSGQGSINQELYGKQGKWNLLPNCDVLPFGLKKRKISGSGTFILLAHLSLRWTGTRFLRQQVQTGLITVWGVRLGTFLFLRILKDGHDRRFDRVRDNPGTFLIYWTMQGIWIFVTLLPSLMLNLGKQEKPLGLRDYLGWSLWTVGFIIQATADQQKWIFKSDPDNAGKFIQTGLWAYSRHPNYLGEILQWSGLFLSASTVLSGYEYVSIISPVFVWFLLSYVSGIPILEKQALKRWGSEAAYQSYISHTPVLWPFKF